MFGDGLYFGSSIVGNVIKVRVLVVDDNSTCLSFTSGLLKLFNYQAVGIARSAVDALSTLRLNPGLFDMVLSEVHLPLINGIEFQKTVEVDFNIPVLLMASDSKEKLVAEVGLDSNACVIPKPPPVTDIGNIWQYVIACRKNRDKAKKQGAKGECSNQKRKSWDGDEDGGSGSNNADDDNNDNANNPSKKPKMVWTTPLHSKFLEAIRVIGYNRAVPKKILEYMNVPGLTRENIASHLQKFRVYMRHVCEAGASAEHGIIIRENWNQRPFRSSFTWSQFPMLASNSFLLNYTNAFNMGVNEHKELRKKYASKALASATTDKSRENRRVRPFSARFKYPRFGASSNQRLKNLLNEASITIVAPEYLTSNDLSAIPLTILESSLQTLPKKNDDSVNKSNLDGGLKSGPIHINDNDVGAASSSSMAVGNNGAQVQDVSTQDQNQKLPATQADGFGENPVVAGINNENHFVESQQPPLPVYSMTEFAKQPQAAAAAMNMGMAHYPKVNNMGNFMSQTSNNFVNISNNVVQQPPLKLYNFGSHHQREPTAFASNMSNIAPQQQPPTSVCNFCSHQFETATNFTTSNMSNYMAHQQQQHNLTFPKLEARTFAHQQLQQQQSIANKAVNMPLPPPNYMVQQSQPHGFVMNMMSDYGNPQPHFAASNNNMMNNMFITPQQMVMANNVNNTSAQSSMAAAGNPLMNSHFTTTNVLQNQEMQGFDFKNGTIDQLHEWAMSTTYEDYSMEHLEIFADGLLSNNDEDNNDGEELYK